jgi:hypothetical protein
VAAHWLELNNLANKQISDDEENFKKLDTEMKKQRKKDLMLQAAVYQLKVIRVMKCWNPQLMRIEANAVPGTTAEAALNAILNHLIQKHKAIEKPGQAPRGALERRISRNLELLQKKQWGDKLMSSLLDEEQ